MPSRRGYEQLSTDDTPGQEATIRDERASNTRKQTLRIILLPASSRLGSWLDYLSIAAVLVAAVSCALSLSLLPPARREGAPRVLRRPNAYIGLENVAFPPNITFSPFVNWPLASFQLRRKDHSRALEQGDRHYMAREGTIVPQDHHIVMSPEVSRLDTEELIPANKDFRRARSYNFARGTGEWNAAS